MQRKSPAAAAATAALLSLLLLCWLQPGGQGLAHTHSQRPLGTRLRLAVREEEVVKLAGAGPAPAAPASAAAPAPAAAKNSTAVLPVPAAAPCLTLTYEATSRLCNQLYAHIPALMLARALRAAVVLPPAMHRRSFADPAEGQVISLGPIQGFFDVEAMGAYWAALGVAIRQVGTCAGGCA